MALNFTTIIEPEKPNDEGSVFQCMSVMINRLVFGTDPCL